MSWLKKDNKGLIQKKLSFLDFDPKEEIENGGTTTEEDEDLTSGDSDIGESLGESDTDSEILDRDPDIESIEDEDLIEAVTRFEKTITEQSSSFGEIKQAIEQLRTNIELLRATQETLIRRIENGTKKKVQKKV